MTNSAVIGTQWGDEGKGKIIDVLTEKHDVIVRYQGGSNAGHTVIIDGVKFVLHLIPSGILRADKVCVLGNGEIMAWEDLNKEISELEEQGVDIGDRLKVSNRMHVIFPYHKIIDIASDYKRKIGTTGRGIGICYADKSLRDGIRAHEFLNVNKLVNRLGKKKESLDAAMQIYLDSDKVKQNLEKELEERDLSQYYDLEKGFNMGLMLEESISNSERFLKYITDTAMFLNSFKGNILFEGAQGVSLDIDHGTYPFVTSSNTGTTGIHSGSGCSTRKIDNITGIMKAYTTRVGEGPFPTEQENALGELLRKNGGEFGATTGRPRRCGYLDLFQVINNVIINDVDEICVTKLDVLAGIDPIKICVGYELAGREVEFFPPDAEDLAQCKPIYEEMPGFKQDITGVNNFLDLPKEAKDYLRKLSFLIQEKNGKKIPLDMISVGPDREQTFRESDSYRN